jgi:hypothetical protein
MTVEKVLVNAADITRVRIFLNGKYPRQHRLETRPAK